MHIAIRLLIAAAFALFVVAIAVAQHGERAVAQLVSDFVSQG